MKTTSDKDSETRLDTEGRFQLIEVHLFDEDAAEEQTLCGTETSATGRRGVRGYLEDRLDAIGVGTICEGCKEWAIPFAEAIAQARMAESLAHEAEEYLRLAVMLRRETGPSTGPVEDMSARPCVWVFCVCP